jgi:glycine/D-amino acid oxidase-like deaminating enzyme
VSESRVNGQVFSDEPPPRHVAVIGAGIVGLCTAWHLQQRGAAVTVIDPNPPGSGCSFGNAGALSPGSVAPLAMPGVLRSVPSMLLDSNGPLHIPVRYALRALPWLAAFVRAARPGRVAEIAKSLAALLSPALDCHAQIAQELGVSDLIRRTGQLYLYRTTDKFAADRSIWALRQRYGVRVDVLDRAGITALEPAISPNYQLGVFLPEQGMCANPQRLSTTIAQGLIRRGARFLTSSATGFRTEGHRVTSVNVADGTVVADAVVVAAGAWSARLLHGLGYRIPLETQRGYHMELEADGPTLGRPVVPADRKVFITPMESGLRVAGTVEFGGLDAPPNERRARQLLGDLAAVFPQFRGAVRPGFWMGHRPCLPDSLPVLGPSRRWQGLWCAFGHGHLGLTGSAVTGELVARAMMREDAAFDFEPVGADRF